MRAMMLGLRTVKTWVTMVSVLYWLEKEAAASALRALVTAELI